MAAAGTDLYYVPESLKREFSTHELAEFLDQFKAFDTSGDGGIDVNELSTMMASMNVHMERTELQQLIAAVDDNNSGQIEFTEFVRMMSNLRRGKANKLGRFMQLAKQAFEIRREYTATVAAPIPGCVIVPFPMEKEDMRQWHVHIAGPETSPYAGGRFTFHFEFGHEYPYEAPSVRLLTRVYHVNFIVLVDGSASAECLTQLWNPDWRSRDLIERIQALLLAPDPSLMEPLYNSAEARLELQGLRYAGTTVRSFGLDCLHLFHTDYKTYCKHARETTAKHAMRA